MEQEPSFYTVEQIARDMQVSGGDREGYICEKEDAACL